jgi:hypothetical protein
MTQRTGYLAQKPMMKIIENAVRIGLPMQTIIELTGLDEEKILSLLPKNK